MVIPKEFKKGKKKVLLSDHVHYSKKHGPIILAEGTVVEIVKYEDKKGFRTVLVKVLGQESMGEVQMITSHLRDPDPGECNVLNWKEDKSKEETIGRQFGTGAYRDTEDGKLDFEGFLSPQVLESFAEYMNNNRKQSNGVLRDSDNWQKGLPKDVYMKSMWRHFHAVWKEHRGIPTEDGIKNNLNGLLFNVMGYLFEQLKTDREFMVDVSEAIRSFNGDGVSKA